MIPKVAARGHSFKGAGQYYLHDRNKAKSSERVGWTYVHNVNTQDAHKAMKHMAYTAMSADRLKQEAGVSTTGRKSSAGAVYTYSLAWHPSEEPKKQTMLDSAFETLELLGLKDHQAVIVQHQETEHPHIHVVANLVNPQNGKTAVMSYDRLALSEWAEEHEKKYGIHCEKRIENNQKRKDLKNNKALRQANEQSGIVKHRAAKAAHAEKIQALYNSCENGRSFAQALEKEGYALAKGDRRGFVLVDETGKVHSLSRQLKGQRAADIKARLTDLTELPNAKTLSQERQYYDREQDNINRQNKELDAADKAGIEKAKQEAVIEKVARAKIQKQKDSPKPIKQGSGREKNKSSASAKTVNPKTSANDSGKSKSSLKDIYGDFVYKSFAEELDRRKVFDKKIEDLSRAFQTILANDDEYKKFLNDVVFFEKQVAKHDTLIGRSLGKYKRSVQDLENARKSLEEADRRREEQRQAHDKKIEAITAEHKRQWEQEQKDRLEMYKKTRLENNPISDNDNQTPDKDKRYDIER